MAKIIMGIQVEQRREIATEVQNLLTEFGCNIKTRIGLHNASDNRDACSETGLILVEFIQNAEKEALELEGKLSKIQNVVVKKMVF